MLSAETAAGSQGSSGGQRCRCLGRWPTAPSLTNLAPRQETSPVQVLSLELRASTLPTASPCTLVSSDLIIKGSHVMSIYGSSVVWGEEALSPVNSRGWWNCSSAPALSLPGMNKRARGRPEESNASYLTDRCLLECYGWVIWFSKSELINQDRS